MQGITSSTESFDHEQLDEASASEAREIRGEVRFVQTGEPAEVSEALQVHVRAYGTQRGALGEHVEEAIENSLRTLGAGAAGIEFDRDEDARLSDELFRARRLGFGGIAVRLTALRALCAPVGGLDAADARTIAFYARATVERPLVLVMDEGDLAIPAFVMSRTLEEIIAGEIETEADAILEPAAVRESPEAPSVSLASILAQELAPEPEPTPTPTPEPEPAEPVMVATPEIPWREYAGALDAARGAQTLASFERLFVHSYMPLANAIDRGLAERRAIEARDEFRRTFSRAYSEALPTFALTGKRPKMVLDAFDVAAKMARAHNARTSQVLVVDGMRFDLAARACARAAELLEGRAQIVDRITLFSALPSSTPRQLESLARGVEALRSAYEDRDVEPMRGRTADTVRRVRVGSRDLYKLDVVETTLAAAGNDAILVMDDLAEETACAITKHARTQNARTMLFVLGDHGFRLDGGTARHGGPSPEEVIVSGHAFLLGDLH
ncbi:MAG TPA: hypothetical protein VH054_26500 [Polyangiaceae bacterium]|nr:hypothetical protein [Polyangiaceae bacterium]